LANRSWRYHDGPGRTLLRSPYDGAPFNFPLNLVAHKVAPAIAVGCPVVLKPASQTPLSSLMLARLLTDVGLPPGWLNVEEMAELHLVTLQ
jgi:acyl-CoA reductase-like NAD-dependent aldehyde dehydrogenase